MTFKEKLCIKVPSLSEILGDGSGDRSYWYARRQEQKAMTIGESE